MRAVHEAVRHEVLERTRLVRVRHHGVLPMGDHRGEGIDRPEIGVAAVDHALVVERDVPAGVDPSCSGERHLEVVEAAPLVAVVRAEGRQIDVAGDEHAIGLDQHPGVTAGVAGQMHRRDRHSTEIDHLTVGEPDRIGAGDVGEVADDDLAERTLRVGRHAVHLHQPVERAGTLHIVLVDVHARTREQVHTGEVVLVGVSEHDHVDRCEIGEIGAQTQRRGRIDDRSGALAADEHGVAGGVAASVDADQRGRVGAEVQIGVEHVGSLADPAVRRRGRALEAEPVSPACRRS